MLVDEATVALGEFAVQRLERVALDLEAILESRGRVTPTAELAARYRVFAGVLRSTGENLDVLQRVAASTSEAGMPWGR